MWGQEVSHIERNGINQLKQTLAYLQLCKMYMLELKSIAPILLELPMEKMQRKAIMCVRLRFQTDHQ
jgi:hypothetical protein